MAAGEDELQPLVGDGVVVHGDLLRRRRRVELPGLRGEVRSRRRRSIGPVAGGGDEPGRGLSGAPVARPAARGDGEGLLRGLLGEVEVAEEADQGREDAPPSSRKACSRGVLTRERAHLDRAAHGRRRDLGRHGDGGVEVVGLEEE